MHLQLFMTNMSYLVVKDLERQYCNTLITALRYDINQNLKIYNSIDNVYIYSHNLSCFFYIFFIFTWIHYVHKR